MAKKKLDNPLKDIDPILEDAFASAVQIKKEVSKSAKSSSKSRNDDSDMIADIQFPELSKSTTGKQLELDIFKNNVKQTQQGFAIAINDPLNVKI